ncbi:MAG: phosphotransferase family protein [Gammaproteobacteria bacterium]
MKPPATPLRRAMQLPCWRGKVTPRPLAGGLSNHNFVVDDAGKKYVARIGGDMPVHNVLRFNEHSCARAAAEAGIAPRIVHAEPDALVTEFVDGTVFDAQLARRNLARIVARLQTLHRHGARAVRGPVLAFSVFHVARHYDKLLRDSAGACRRAAELPRLLRIADELEAASGASMPALCHNDLMAANFIDDGEICIIDWEHAGLGAPLFDLANLAANNAFAGELEREMLECYYAAPPDDALWRRYKALRAASHQREAMWSMTAEIHSELEQDFAAYTDANLAQFDLAYAAFRAL